MSGSQTSIVVERIRVSAFRGVADEIDIAFPGRLNVLYAPNGTGKTTLCEAIEWALTDDIARLSPAREEREQVLRCSFSADDTETYVELDLLLFSGALYLRRELDRAYVRESRTGAWRETNTAKLLGLIAPSAASTSSHHKTALAERTAWIRGNRFLSSDMLSVLVDSTPEMRRRRRQVFADLLGVRSLLDTEHKLTRLHQEFRKRLKKVRSTIASLEHRELDAARRIAEFASKTREQPGSHALSVATQTAGQLADALELSRIPTTEDVDSLLPEQMLVHLESFGARARLELGRRQQAEDLLSQEMEHYGDLVQESKAGARAQSLLAKELKSLRKNFHEVQHRAKQQDREFQERRQALRDAQAWSKTLVAACKIAVRRLSYLPDEESWSDITEHATRLGRTQENVIEQRHALASEIDANSSLFQRLESAVMEQHGDGQRSVIGAKIAELEQDRLRAQEAVARARNQVATRRDELGRLRSSSIEFLDRNPDATSCPTCGHEYERRQALEDHVLGAQDIVPHALEAVEAALSSAESRLDRATEAADAAREELRVFDEREREITDIRLRVGAYRQRARRLDVEAPGSGLAAALRSAARDSARANAVLDFLDTVDSMPDEARSEQESRVGAGGTWRMFILGTEELAARVVRELAALQLQSAARNEELAREVRDMSGARLVHETQRMDLERRAAVRRRRIEAIEGALRTFNLDADTAADSLADIRARLHAAEGMLTSVEAALEFSKEIGKNAAREQGAREDLSAVQNHRERERERLRKHKKLTQAVESLLGEVEIRRKKHGSATVSDLIGSVRTLFARSQANSVIDTITQQEDGDPLRWWARAGAVDLDPEKHFSQGQRQDLALAVFLARARTVGGTFMLDEPIVHLDDLNRVALLDMLRVLAVEDQDAQRTTRLVVTTASRSLVRHLRAKIAAVSRRGDLEPLIAMELVGNAATRVECYPL